MEIYLKTKDGEFIEASYDKSDYVAWMIDTNKDDLHIMVDDTLIFFNQTYCYELAVSLGIIDGSDSRVGREFTFKGVDVIVETGERDGCACDHCVIHELRDKKKQLSYSCTEIIEASGLLCYLKTDENPRGVYYAKKNK